MKNSKGYPRMFMVLLMALLPSVFLAGCHGNLGWDRAPIPIGCQNKGGFEQSQQVYVGPEDARGPVEHDALIPSAEKNLVDFLECPGYPRSNVV